MLKRITVVSYHPDHVRLILRSLTWRGQSVAPRSGTKRRSSAGSRMTGRGQEERAPPAGPGRLSGPERRFRAPPDPVDLGANREDPGRDPPRQVEEGARVWGPGLPLRRPHNLQAALPDQARRLQHCGDHPLPAGAPCCFRCRKVCAYLSSQSRWLKVEWLLPTRRTSTRWNVLKQRQGQELAQPAGRETRPARDGARNPGCSLTFSGCGTGSASPSPHPEPNSAVEAAARSARSGGLAAGNQTPYHLHPR